MLGSDTGQIGDDKGANLYMEYRERYARLLVMQHCM